METINRFSQIIDVRTELAEVKQKPQPKLNSVLVEISPLPHEALFLGIAEDGLSVLLNLNDPVPGPILIAADQASGKTKLLQMIARAAEFLHASADIQYAVITHFPEEWSGFQENQINTGIHSTGQINTQELVRSLFNWAHRDKSDAQSILLLIDGFESAKNMDPAYVQNLRWLLLRGPSHHIWPIITINSRTARSVESWLPFFRTRLFGKIQDPTDSKFIAGDTSDLLADLTSGSQFAMREGNAFLKFSAPSMD
jgi:hypothetical protein